METHESQSRRLPKCRAVELFRSCHPEARFWRRRTLCTFAGSSRGAQRSETFVITFTRRPQRKSAILIGPTWLAISSFGRSPQAGYPPFLRHGHRLGHRPRQIHPSYLFQQPLRLLPRRVRLHVVRRPPAVGIRRPASADSLPDPHQPRCPWRLAARHPFHSRRWRRRCSSCRPAAIARELGGRTLRPLLTAICVALAPQYLSNGGLLGTNVLGTQLSGWAALTSRSSPSRGTIRATGSGSASSRALVMEEKYTIAVFGAGYRHRPAAHRATPRVPQQMDLDWRHWSPSSSSCRTCSGTCTTTGPSCS